MRRVVLITALVVCMSGVASADLSFTSTVTPDVKLNEGQTYTVIHDLGVNPPGLTVPPDIITSANLVLSFDDDPWIRRGKERLPYDLALEWAWVNIEDGLGGTSDWMLIGEPLGVPTLPFAINPVWLNSDGLLKVDVTIDDTPLNDLPFGGFLDRFNGADAYWVESELSGTYVPSGTQVPVPGAVLLGMLGLSVAGLKLRKHA